MGLVSLPSFKIGDVVRLKSGGPDMTVVGAPAKELWCRYFDLGIMRISVFHGRTLELVDPWPKKHEDRETLCEIIEEAQKALRELDKPQLPKYKCYAMRDIGDIVHLKNSNQDMVITDMSDDESQVCCDDKVWVQEEELAPGRYTRPNQKGPLKFGEHIDCDVTFERVVGTDAALIEKDRKISTTRAINFLCKNAMATVNRDQPHTRVNLNIFRDGKIVRAYLTME